ncbi:response regulator FixJ [Acetobacter vaccinii]|uniref:Response regulator n=1 Tax=Acetobacter vaccinii TaxID=2592655 RepID=A0A5C1YSS1_9PROT|nr:response regulator FixJ [Acetobacter vaccinii]QEO18755.1 response regulator [Acetobacter vaccinii]
MNPDCIVHVIDDDEAVRESLVFLLLASGYTVRSYASADEFLVILNQIDCGCVITDIRMPGMDGLALVNRLQEGNSLLPVLPVIVITGHADIPLAVHAMKAGARDFIEKPFDEHSILNAVASALQCGVETSAERTHTHIVRQKIAVLTKRERQVLNGLVEGQSNKTIARELEISPRTIEIYRANLMTKMEAHSLSELVRMALMAKSN